MVENACEFVVWLQTVERLRDHRTKFSGAKRLGQLLFQYRFYEGQRSTIDANKISTTQRRANQDDWKRPCSGSVYINIVPAGVLIHVDTNLARMWGTGSSERKLGRRPWIQESRVTITCFQRQSFVTRIDSPQLTTAM